MNVRSIYNRMKSRVDDEWVDRAKDALSPVYRTAIYNAYQPVQNRIQFRRRLQNVPQYDFDDRDVLFLVVDCLRNDHLSRSGYSRETTPFLDSVGTYHPNCVSAAPWTYPSVPSILTGLYPHNHGAIFEADRRNNAMNTPLASVRDDVHTLSEILAKDGYETFLTAGIVTAELSVRGRFRRANAHYDGVHDAPANEMVDHLLDWWDSTDGNRFGYVHFADLHADLRRPEVQPFGAVPDIPDLEHWDYTHTTEPQEEFDRYRRERTRLYDTNLHFLDTQIRRLFKALAERGDLDDTLIVVLGDHGEEFWERVELQRAHFDDPRGIYGTGHGHALIPEVLFVPLIIVGGDDQPTDDWVSTTDVAPTVLTELGLPDEHVSAYDGVPLQRPETGRAVLSEEVAYGWDQQAVVRDNHLLIHSPHEDETVVLDLKTDDLVDDDDLEAELKGYLAEEKRSGNTATIDSQTKNQLADLGYI